MFTFPLISKSTGVVGLLTLFSTLLTGIVVAQGRVSPNRLPESEILSLAKTQYDSFLATHLVVDSLSKGDYPLVQKVAKNLIAAAGKYANGKKKLKTILESYSWNINLIGKQEENAWWLPGGQLAIYSGLLPLTQSEPSLALFLAHELAHLLLQHGNNRMNDYLIEKFNKQTLKDAYADRPGDCIVYFKLAYGMESNAGLWDPFSEEQEKEADALGLTLSKLAGYKPRVALVFWERMARLGGTGLQPELMSMHPVYPGRIREMKRIIDEDNGLY